MASSHLKSGTLSDPPPPPRVSIDKFAEVGFNQLPQAKYSSAAALSSSPLNVKTVSNFTRHVKAKQPFKRKVLITSKTSAYSSKISQNSTCTALLEQHLSGATTSRDSKNATLTQLLNIQQPRTARDSKDFPSEKQKFSKTLKPRGLRSKTPNLIQTTRPLLSQSKERASSSRAKNMPLRRNSIGSPKNLTQKSETFSSEQLQGLRTGRLLSEAECKKLLSFLQSIQRDMSTFKKETLNQQYQELFKNTLQRRSKENQQAFEKMLETYQAIDIELHRQLSKKVELLGGVRPIIESNFEILLSKGLNLINYNLLSRFLNTQFSQCRCSASVRALTRNFESLSEAMGLFPKGCVISEKQRENLRGYTLSEKLQGLLNNEEKQTFETLDLLQSLEPAQIPKRSTSPPGEHKSNDVSFMSESAFISGAQSQTKIEKTYEKKKRPLRVELNKEEDNCFTLSVNNCRPLLLNIDDLGNLKLRLNPEKESLEIQAEGLPVSGLLDQESMNANDPLPSELPFKKQPFLDTTFSKENGSKPQSEQQPETAVDSPRNFFFNSPPIVEESEQDIPAAFRQIRQNMQVQEMHKHFTEDSPSPAKPQLWGSPLTHEDCHVLKSSVNDLPKTPSFVKGAERVGFSSSQSFGALSTQRSENPSTVNYSSKAWTYKSSVPTPILPEGSGKNEDKEHSNSIANTFANELFSSLICVPCKYSRYIIRDVLKEVENIDSKVESLNVSVNTLITSHLQRQKYFPYSNRTELQSLLRATLQCINPALSTLNDVLPQHAQLFQKLVKFLVVIIERVTVMAVTCFSKFSKQMKQVSHLTLSSFTRDNEQLSPRSLKAVLEENKKLRLHNSLIAKQLEELSSEYENIKQYRDELSRKLEVGISQLDHNVQKHCENSEKSSSEIKEVSLRVIQEIEVKVNSILEEFKNQHAKIDKLVDVITSAEQGSL